ncbi:MAG TPA: inner-membrane translocator [Dictyobacter sp.]|jgi:D-xylose transport system permease protein|nr:inner-membrane translocator [Dictyobacter sp.]
MSEIIDDNASTSTAEVAAAASTVEAPSYQNNQSFGQLLRNDLGFLPVLLTLILIVIFFDIVSHGLFLGPQNFSNLFGQVVPLGVFAVGIVPVLLLGEIDLSSAAVGYLCAVIMGVLAERVGWSVGLAIVAALLVGAIIGAINGFLVAVLRIPSFIVTLAAFIAYSGLILFLLFGQTTLIIDKTFILNLTNGPLSYLTNFWGVFLPILGVVLYIASLIFNYSRRKKAGLRTISMGRLIAQSAAVAIVVIAALTILQNYNGVPVAVALLFAFIVIEWLGLTKTTAGRHIYAVGGNTEAARRAGINVTLIRMSVFILCSVMAAVAGILSASRVAAVISGIPQTLQLDIIAAAVIGGVSLFGGRGSAWAVVLGMLVVECLENGLALLNQPTDVAQMVEGAVLILAVTADALIRRAQARSRSGR